MKRASLQHRLISIVCSIPLLAVGVGSAEAAIPAAERTTLLNFYASTNGASWKISTNWNGASGAPVRYWLPADGGRQRVRRAHTLRRRAGC